MSYIKLGLIASSLFAVTHVAFAEEPRELRERAWAMQHEATELAERGREVEAKKLHRRSLELLEEAEHQSDHGLSKRDTEIRQRKELLEQLRLKARELEGISGNEKSIANIRGEAKRIERELRELTWGGQHDGPAPHQQAVLRLEHLHAAADHLHHAGLHDIAKHVEERAEAAEREIHEHQQPRGDDPIHEVMKQLEEMRHELKRMREAMKELKR